MNDKIHKCVSNEDLNLNKSAVIEGIKIKKIFKIALNPWDNVFMLQK
ncbi:hypothetical protein PL321_05625 [Caloramator sp. mosi_1]|nr:hypothetical protein [Caloramator sp. mosi_1]WDC85013.1 hypothetical protein PL321_05625 [Caloramator sp. mosi_1]